MYVTISHHYWLPKMTNELIIRIKPDAKSKLSRRKATFTRHINGAENLLKLRGSRSKLRKLAAKIEEAFKELERPSEEYE